MQTVNLEYQGSAHYSNPSGVRVECADCHIPRDSLGFVAAKIGAVRDLYHHYITGKINTDEKFEAHRTEMAETVWRRMMTDDSRTCRSCHSEEVMAREQQKPEAKKMHALGIENKNTCIECHKGLAHFLPEMKMDTQALAQLEAAAAPTPGSAPVVYPFRTISMGDLGTINPATSLAVLKAEGGKRTVRLEGFQMEGAEQVMYLGQNQRAIIAMMTEAGQQTVQAGEYVADEYGNKWRTAVLEAEVEAPVLASREPLWAYAAELDTVFCSTCHAKIPGHHFTINAWPSVAKSMGERTSIDKDDLEILTKFFQYHAKDSQVH